jgi:hypothetical protein
MSEMSASLDRVAEQLAAPLPLPPLPGGITPSTPEHSAHATRIMFSDKELTDDEKVAGILALSADARLTDMYCASPTPFRTRIIKHKLNQTLLA